jgi:hypothetical protein
MGTCMTRFAKARTARHAVRPTREPPVALGLGAALLADEFECQAWGDEGREKER